MSKEIKVMTEEELEASTPVEPNYKARYETFEHIELVMRNLAAIQHHISQRMFTHDRSKLLPPEVEMFEKYTHRLRGLTYGSPEYEECRQAMMKEALPLHYTENKHHPEHYENGIEGMDMVSLIEMFCDWYAACKRHADGNIYRSIEINERRFGICPQLISIMKNSVRLLEENPYGGPTQRGL
jgi:hypothetical protein